MSEPFLEEQLRRLREMSERMTEVHNRLRGLERPAPTDRPSQRARHAPHRPSRRHSTARRRT